MMLKKIGMNIIVTFYQEFFDSPSLSFPSLSFPREVVLVTVCVGCFSEQISNLFRFVVLNYLLKFFNCRKQCVLQFSYNIICLFSTFILQHDHNTDLTSTHIAQDLEKYSSCSNCEAQRNLSEIRRSPPPPFAMFTQKKIFSKGGSGRRFPNLREYRWEKDEKDTVEKIKERQSVQGISCLLSSSLLSTYYSLCGI